jgi:hypothetical protein
MNECKQCKHRVLCKYAELLLNATCDTSVFARQTWELPFEMAITNNCKHYDWDYEAERGGDVA